MAKQTSLITFTGKLGNMIGYQRKNHYFLRSAPDTVRQTENTRRAAKRFGSASKKGALIRHAFCGQMEGDIDGTHVNRLTKAFIMNGRNHEAALKGFRFNQYTGIDHFFSIAPACSPEGVVHIPAQLLPVIKGSTALEVKVITATVSFGTQRIIHTNIHILTLNPGEYFAGAFFKIDQSSTGISVVTIQVRALREGIPSYSKKHMAADIIAVITPEREYTSDKAAYVQQHFSHNLSEVHFTNAHLHQSPVFIQRE
ncbi:hypothetical protein [Chitinophaga pinensis]|uniref:Uncharacterized protein n=1 Tax=Chitinophaga pinensis (strain ATCC 43595 / DSM 2588 / LMG 13176 / NBRC 15968 / NCIMB 11800 / UQM 2034) TaxID=485918 RepID=A0A979G7L7_CHIPD|nr:hypothetical protein [Chitinophaga pinensis]ACU62409.1 hypothetical protein Cpin_4976 [Chitinophaga pinensis DSM 2588]